MGEPRFSAAYLDGRGLSRPFQRMGQWQTLFGFGVFIHLQRGWGNTLLLHHTSLYDGYGNCGGVGQLCRDTHSCAHSFNTCFICLVNPYTGAALTTAQAATQTPVPPSPTAEVATQTPAPVEPTQTPEPITITSEILNFELEDLTIAAGTTITWVNEDSAPHTTTAGAPSALSGEWDSKTMSLASQFSFTFQETGSFPYFCVIHPFMTATITVVGSTSQALNNDDY